MTTNKGQEKQGASVVGKGLQPIEGANKDAFSVICNPENPYGEYVIIYPKDYVEGFKYEDYVKVFKPIT